MLDRWALELQQFDIQSQFIEGKKNVDGDAMSRLQMLGLYQDNDNEDMIEDIVKNIIEEIQSADTVPNKPAYNVGKLNLEVLRKEQQQDQFCKNKVKDMKKTPDPNFLLDNNSILRKVVKLKYTIGPAIFVLKKLTSLIIIEFHTAKGHQVISHTVNMIRCYFWSIGIWQDVHQHIRTCRLCIQFLPNKIYMQPMHSEIPQVPFAGCAMDCIGPLPATLKGHSMH